MTRRHLKAGDVVLRDSSGAPVLSRGCALAPCVDGLRLLEATRKEASRFDGGALFAAFDSGLARATRIWRRQRGCKRSNREQCALNSTTHILLIIPPLPGHRFPRSVAASWIARVRPRRAPESEPMGNAARRSCANAVPTRAC